jgi:hypothetical protein
MTSQLLFHMKSGNLRKFCKNEKKLIHIYIRQFV